MANSNSSPSPPKSWEWYGDAIKWFIAIAAGVLAFGFEHATADRLSGWQQVLYLAAAASLGLSILSGLLAYLQLLGAANLVEVANPDDEQKKRLARRKRWLGRAYIGNVALLGIGIVGFTTIWVLTVWAHETTAAPSSGPTIYVQGRPGVPMELSWFRDSAERQAVYSEVYAEAWRRVQAATAQGSDAAVSPSKNSVWGVVLDIDETVLDNSEYQARLAVTGRPFEALTWNAWVAEKLAPAFAPAKEFISKVKSHGGRVILVTNRLESQCESTRANLGTDGVDFDDLLCAQSEPPEKETRFADIQSGRALAKVGPVRVVLFIGDDIRDCQGQTQGSYDLGKFSDRCLALPDPMYGSWTANPYR